MKQKINTMTDEFKETKNIVDRIISSEDEFSLGYVVNEVEKNGGIKRVAVECNIENYLDGLVEIRDLSYDYFNEKYSKRKNYNN